MGGRRGGTGQWSDRAGGLARCGFVFCDQCAAYTAVLALPNHFGLAVRPSRPSVERPFFRWRWLVLVGVGWRWLAEPSNRPQRPLMAAS